MDLFTTTVWRFAMGGALNLFKQERSRPMGEG